MAASAKNWVLNGATAFIHRHIGLKTNTAGGAKLGITGQKPNKPLLGFYNNAYLQVGTKTSAAGFLLQAGDYISAEIGLNMTLTINTGAGALAVSSNGLDITVTLASSGSTAAAVVTAINAQLNSSFALATLNQGSAGGSNVAALTKTNLLADNRYQAIP